MKKSNYLFAIYIGGSHTKSLIELHDIRFVIASSIESTYQILRDSWWGNPKSLHIDAWGILQYVDGYEIIISDHPGDQMLEKLYFANLGGYDDHQFTELHKNIFLIARNINEAKALALHHVNNWKLPHRDFLFEVENVYEISNIIDNNSYYIKLLPSSHPQDFKFICNYIPIGI